MSEREADTVKQMAAIALKDVVEVVKMYSFFIAVSLLITAVVFSIPSAIGKLAFFVFGSGTVTLALDFDHFLVGLLIIIFVFVPAAIWLLTVHDRATDGDQGD